MDVPGGYMNTWLKRIMFIAGLEIVSFYVIYIFGGTHTAVPYVIFIPILLGAYFWGAKGGLAVGALSGLVIGPFMPLYVEAGEMQSMMNWSIRLLSYSLIGLAIGYTIEKIEKLNEAQRERDNISVFTGLYNINKMLPDLNEKIVRGETFSLIAFKITNLDGIGKYVNYHIIDQVIERIIQDLSRRFGRDYLYSMSDDEIVILTDVDDETVYHDLSEMIEGYSSSTQIGRYVFRIAIKAGMVHYEGEADNGLDVFNKARVALDQQSEFGTGVFYYDEAINRKNQLNYEIAGSLLNAIEQDEFYLVFQPKIDLTDYSVKSAEVLLRWDRGHKTPIGPGEFITVAEEVGHIKRISKWVIEKALDQIVAWREKGIDIKVAINLTTHELMDEAFIEWKRAAIKERGLEFSQIAIEITERVTSQNNQKLLKSLSKLRTYGHQVEIDDYGKGYNSLMNVGEIDFDTIKIDKYFIDRLERPEMQALVRSMISYAHELGRNVVAEGVETAKQVDVLQSLNCDRAQGYYFSHPLTPDQFEQYYNEQLIS
ncbi:EAL domain-containing protein (putative c-di-GMP-specific phosphodiesterase class I)/GGDEF domain-containing protein [Alkalibacillus flavidus]|uniref:EAL domain-containing protein (Putative c-di-GMP-specific phosphodiesterase class I)/GGDEF domain-containing protein n=1 Tax=Alkalibacillus flavidus TaxID=546021 RepID=A0ABV2KVH6_9BACI